MITNASFCIMFFNFKNNYYIHHMQASQPNLKKMNRKRSHARLFDLILKYKYYRINT